MGPSHSIQSKMSRGYKGFPESSVNFLCQGAREFGSLREVKIRWPVGLPDRPVFEGPGTALLTFTLIFP